MADKQQLNGAYYGPSIPPPQHYHRPGRGGCGCGCCLLRFLFKLIVSVVVIVGLAILIFWLIFHPNKVKFHVTDATLTEFNFSSNNTLQYNLNVTITIRNPNKKIGIYYDTIEARALYEDERLESKFLTPFYQGHKNTSLLYPVFKGQNVVVLSGNQLTQFNQETASGVFSIDVKLYLKIRFKVGKIKIGKFKPKVKCGLKVPLNGTGGDSSEINSKCDVDF